MVKEFITCGSVPLVEVVGALPSIVIAKSEDFTDIADLTVVDVLVKFAGPN
jgi:hypothetical protein